MIIFAVGLFGLITQRQVKRLHFPTAFHQSHNKNTIAMKTEIWKRAPGFEDYYEVSSLGNVRSFDRMKWSGKGFYSHPSRLLKKSLNKTGYYYICLKANNKSKKIKVSQLVAMAFLGHRPNGHKVIVDHINNVKTDDRLENLQLITQRENLTKDSQRMYSKYRGVTYHKNKKRWQAAIYYNKKNYYLGQYKTELEASQAYELRLSQVI